MQLFHCKYFTALIQPTGNIYSNVKFGYDTRSKVVHGDYLKKEEAKIRECSIILDEYLRKLIKMDEPFDIKDSEIDSFYLNKLFE